ncbi:ATP-binding response regulator [Marinirhabdus gelatinilytica]|uniref:histidine kinase n=1 Tax=Marinirhabdus gelatinilytica TaxID=1703343 RepID=A0A370Q4G2_9FLAO|nr:response regulator [Marinirhabdus gelatinilytica]RDK83255.1 phospho-acceptor domain-containing protein [Marinirhabdus gelatinilytica]
MNKIVPVLIFSLYFGLYGLAQNPDTQKIVTDSVAKTATQKEIDTLYKFVEQQYFQKNYDEAIEKGKFAISLAEKEGYVEKIIDLSSLIGNSFLKSQDTIASKKIFSENIDRALKNNDPKSIVNAQIDLANLYALQDQSQEAIQLYEEAITSALKSADTISLFILHNNISDLSINEENVALASYHVPKTVEYAEYANSPYFSVAAKSLQGRLSFIKGDAKSAIRILEACAVEAKEINFDEILIQIYEYLSKSYVLDGDYRAAYNANSELQVYLSKQYETDKIQAIETATARFKLEQYELELKEQALQAEIDKQETKRQTQLFWVKIASGILFIFFLFLLYTYLRRRKLLKNLKQKNKQYLEEKEKTEELSKAKSRLFSNMTHELRTPMYGIIGISNMLLKNSRFDTEKEQINTLKFSADYLLSLINNALYFNKIDAEKNEELKENVFNIRKIVASVVDSIKFLNNGHPNEFIIEIDEDIPEKLKGDEIKLSQVLMNLLSNASKFTDDGIIVVRLKKLETIGEDKIKIGFSIKDNGIGIHPEKQKDIFNDFVQDNDFQQNNINGTGLGLPIVKKILKQLKSKIQLTSEVGDGTEVQFDIIYKVAKAIDLSIDNKRVDTDALRGKKILIVDDNKINRMVTQREVENYGAEATLAPGGEEAIKLFKEQDFDLILMDINMPGMNGFETTEYIRNINETIPILALTAVEREKVLEQNRFSLMDDIVIKPYKGEQFINTLAKHL